jgi:DnaJ-class molecular chaperone
MKSFTSFCYEQKYIKHDDKFICRECNGRGQVVADYERPDPVEGYKMADRVTCPSCGGAKYTTEKDYREFFKIQQAKFREEQREERLRASIRKQALIKLTKEEREVLGV